MTYKKKMRKQIDDSIDRIEKGAGTLVALERQDPLTDDFEKDQYLNGLVRLYTAQHLFKNTQHIFDGDEKNGRERNDNDSE